MKCHEIGACCVEVPRPQPGHRAACHRVVLRRLLRSEHELHRLRPVPDRQRQRQGVCDDAPTQRRGDRQSPEFLRRLLLVMRQRRDQREARNPVGIVERHRKRDGAAERMADEQRLLQPQRLDEAHRLPRLLGKPPVEPHAACRIARTRPVDGDQPITFAELFHQWPPQVMQRAAETVDHHDRPPLAALDIMDAVAVDRDERSARGHGAFRLARYAGCDPEEIGGNHDDGGKDGDDDAGYG